MEAVQELFTGDSQLKKGRRGQNEVSSLSFSLSLSLSIYIYIYIYTSTLLFNAIFDVTADSPSSKHVPEAHFKLYAIESGTSFGLPQNV